MIISNVSFGLKNNDSRPDYHPKINVPIQEEKPPYKKPESPYQARLQRYYLQRYGQPNPAKTFIKINPPDSTESDENIN